jgi:hypothetical protein
VDGLIRDFLKDDPIYLKLDDVGKPSVERSIKRDLCEADKDMMMSDRQIEEYKGMRLRMWVPCLLQNTLDLQVGMDNFMAHEAQTRAKSPIEHVSWRDPNGLKR